MFQGFICLSKQEGIDEVHEIYQTGQERLSPIKIDFL